MEAHEYLQSLVAAARVAQKEYEKMPQAQVDAAVKAIGKAVYDNAEELAHMAVEETRMGRYDSKIAKCKNKSKSTTKKGKLMFIFKDIFCMITDQNQSIPHDKIHDGPISKPI